jgi:methionyl-tRNA synthetase
MASKEEKFYITTSIVYTNAPPHIGFALESIQADVLARYNRLLGKDVLFLTGTDEHGIKVAQAAKNENKTPKEFVDEISGKVESLKKLLNLSNNDFIRTTDQKKHWPSVRKVWLKLKENGDIFKKNYQGLYCSGCEAFVTKKELINGKCALHGEEPEIVEEENYFFKLSKYTEEIKRVIERGELKILPEARRNEILSLTEKGLEDVSFSRPRKSLEWGIPVPDDEDQTIYVWADALTNYISAIGYEKESPEFKKYWPADVHIIGKDILRFHAAIWPGMLLSLKLPLPKVIFVHGFITVAGQKMSKSLGNVIDPFELVEKYSSASSPQVSTDAVRYFLLREIPAAEDGDFTYEKFEARYNADLASGLGNLVARVLTVAEKIKPQLIESEFRNPELTEEINNVRKKYEKFLDEFKFNEALTSIWELISFCDKYIDKKRPWEETEDQTAIIAVLLYAIGNIAKMLQPFLPETSEKIFHQLGIKPTEQKWQFKIKKEKPLFPRLK